MSSENLTERVVCKECPLIQELSEKELSSKQIRVDSEKRCSCERFQRCNIEKYGHMVLYGVDIKGPTKPPTFKA